MADNPSRVPQLGTGQIEVQSFAGSSSISTLRSTYPLKLVSPPCKPTHRAALAFTMSYGGGLVAGDSVDLTVTVRPKARLGLLTQGSTKVYKTKSSCKDSMHSRQSLTASVEDGAALLLLPDPVQPFRNSAYDQRQVFALAAEANLFVLDWVCAGRAARGEEWEFSEYTSRNEVWDVQDCAGSVKAKKKKLRLRDNLVLKEALSPSASFSSNFRDEMDGLGVFGSVIMRGPLFRGLGDFFLAKYEQHPRIGLRRQGEDLCPSTSIKLWTAASIRGCVMVKFGARDVDSARRWLREMLVSEGTVEREFGPKALLCLQ
ncbi:UreD urease accessory protein-domain-containing protein [Aspergillus pseudoustus]|uniref:UreD urease accessory protein-domain-containing protein n=1 Tax=Aspergillus pseudoustus TaxID=1810923 RepID=A0ABR4J6C8_9EURO